MAAIDSAIIVGGGIAGLVCARALALRGVAVTLLERRAAITDEGGIGIGIQSNAMDALGSIGLAQRCIDSGVPVERIFLHAPDGSVMAEQPAVRHFGTSWPGYTGMSRAALHGVLAEGAAEAGVTLVTGAEVAGFEQDADQVRVALADGSTLPADLLIAADGIYSRIRAALFHAYARARPMREGVWRARIKEGCRQEVRIMYGGRVGTIGYTPLAEDTYLYVVDEHSRAPARNEPDPAARLIELIGDVPGFPGEMIANVSQIRGDVSYRQLETVALPDPWYVGRVVIIGDAAHAGPPTLAQGAAMGIEDGVVLAEMLGGESTIETALAAFMHRRFERVRTILDASITISEAQMEPNGRARMIEAQRAAAAVLAHRY